MQLPSPAKINLSLAVGSPDESGFHPVDTTIHLLAFGDTLTFKDADQLTVTCSRDLGIAQRDNLAYRAAQLMGETFARPTPVAIHIDKQIPHGAGLGGGSSNAATVLRGLATRWQIPLDDERLIAVARTLGSDVPVFLAPTACSQMGGRGDELRASCEPRSGQPVVLAMVEGAHASTAAVYRAFDAIGVVQPAAAYRNDLADAAMAVCDETRQILVWLRTQPETVAAQVSGSGAASFAMTSSADAADALAQRAVDTGFWAVATTLL